MTDRTIVDVDARGRVSLAGFGIKYTQVLVDQLPDGGLAMHRAIALTPAEASHFTDPIAQAALERELKDARAGRVRKATLRSESPTPADTKHIGASPRRIARDLENRWCCRECDS